MAKSPELFVLEEMTDCEGIYFSGLFTQVDKAQTHIKRVLAKRHNLKEEQINVSYDGDTQILAKFRTRRIHFDEGRENNTVEFQYTKAIIDPEG